MVFREEHVKEFRDSEWCAVCNRCVYATRMRQDNQRSQKKTQTSECKLMYTHDFQVNASSQETSQTQYQKLKKKVKQIKQNKADLQQSI